MLEHGATGHCTSSGGHPDALTTHLPSEKWCLWDPAWNYTPPVGERDKNEHPGVPHAWQKLPTGTTFGPSTMLARQPRVPMCLQAWVPTITYHTLFSRSVVSHHQHHRATANKRRKWQSGLRLGSLPWAVPVQLLPQCLGVGHSAGPVDVQIPAAGGEREPV